MQFENDPLHIIILNNNQVVHLADSSELQSGMPAGKDRGSITDSKLLPAEVIATCCEGWANMELKVKDRTVGLATLVYQIGGPERVWFRVHACHNRSMSEHEDEQPRMPMTSPPALPWMAITFGPNFMASLTAAQLFMAVVWLWRCSYAIRQGHASDFRWN
jgi:hypothetical protein